MFFDFIIISSLAHRLFINTFLNLQIYEDFMFISWLLIFQHNCIEVIALTTISVFRCQVYSQFCVMLYVFLKRKCSTQF